MNVTHVGTVIRIMQMFYVGSMTTIMNSIVAKSWRVSLDRSAKHRGLDNELFAFET